VNLYVEQLGAGPDVLLLHGWGLHGGLAADRPTLGQNCRSRWVDLPGHGQSGGGRRVRMAAVAEAVSRGAPPGAVWVVGPGGMVTLALRHGLPCAVS